MWTLYKTIATRHIAITILLGTSMLLGFTATGWAQESPYTIENVKVDVTAENALAARDKAFAQAQSAAFIQLARQIMHTPPDTSVTLPADSVIAGMVQDFEVTREKLSAVRYIGTYTFRFDPAGVKRYFGNVALAAPSDATLAPPQTPPQLAIPAPIAALPAPSGSLPAAQPAVERLVLVIPYFTNFRGQTNFGTSPPTMLWERDNAWLQALANFIGYQSAQQNSGVAVIAPLGDLADLRDIASPDPQVLTPAGLDAMRQRYGATDVIVAKAALYDNGELRVDLLRPDGAQISPAGQFVLTRKFGQNTSDLMAEAAMQLIQNLGPSNAPAMTPAYAAAPTMTIPTPAMADAQSIRAEVQFSSLEEWAHIQDALGRIPTLAERQILSLSTGQATLALPVRSGVDVLNTALAQMGMRLSPAPQGDYYILTLASPTPGTMMQ